MLSVVAHRHRVIREHARLHPVTRPLTKDGRHG